MTTATVCIDPILAALARAEDILGPNRIWMPTSHKQERFLAEFFNPNRDEVLGISEIESIASWEAEDINRFLRERGFSVQLEEFDADTFGVAATLILLLEWAVKGKKEKFQAADGKKYDGVRMEKEVRYFTSPHHPNPIARIETKSGDDVYLSVMDKSPADFDMVADVASLQSTLQNNWEFGDLVFPMVDLDQLVDISWLIKMWTFAETGQRAWISQAKQQTIFKMNEVGALLKSAVAVAVTLECLATSKPDLVIDRPFLVWIVRKGLSVPLLVAHITQENWRDPGKLSK